MLPEPDGIGHFVNVRPDLRYHLVATGPHDALPIIMLHGFPEFWWSWRFQLRFFGNLPFRAMAVDFRGVNYSDKPKDGYDPENLARDIIGLMDELRYDQAVIMGNDYGGIVTYVLGMLHPARVKALVVLNALHPPRWPSRARSGRVGMRIFTILAKLAYHLGTPFLETANRIAGIGAVMKPLARNRKAVPFAVRHAYSRAYARYAATALAYVPAIAHWLETRIPTDLTIRPPTLILCPDGDFTAPHWVTRSIPETMPDARLVVVPDCGHWVQQEQPDFVNETILNFLQEVGRDATD
jgi:pimeloyl-ACP methyl ester carboxylesterase